MNKYNSFIELKASIHHKLLSDLDILREERDRKADEDRLIQLEHRKRFNALFERVIGRVQYYGVDYKVLYSTRSMSTYIRIGDIQIRISDHPVSRGNYSSNIDFLTYESPAVIAAKLIKLKTFLPASPIWRTIKRKYICLN